METGICQRDSNQVGRKQLKILTISNFNNNIIHNDFQNIYCFGSLFVSSKKYSILAGRPDHQTVLKLDT